MKWIKHIAKICFYLIVLSLLISFKLQVSIENNNNIIWYEDLKLNKSLFKMQPPKENRPELAMISCGVSYDYEIKDNSVLYLKVFAIMDCNKSWMKDSSKLILIHERTHFDITEVFARRIRKKLSELIDNKIPLAKMQVDTLLEKNITACNIYNSRYDSLVYSSPDQEIVQQKLTLDVNSQLTNLKEFETNQEFCIHLKNE